MAYHLAQMNIARALYDLEDPAMHGFTSRLDEINGLAERSPGFVWRLQGEDGNAMDIRTYEDPRIVVNLSVWESTDALFDFTYHSDHVQVFAARRQWFEHPGGKPVFVLWWVPEGHQPSAEEGKERLALLAEEGPNPRAFTLKRRFPPPA